MNDTYMYSIGANEAICIVSRCTTQSTKPVRGVTEVQACSLDGDTAANHPTPASNYCVSITITRHSTYTVRRPL